jgi:predicted PurR-regulated permease PerM
MAGSAIVWVPAAIYLAASGHWVKATFLAVWGAGVIGTIDNVLRPRLVGGRTRLHDLVVFFAVLGGIQVFGILGVITGPVIAAVAFTLVEVWRESRRAPAAAAACSP